jgi:hypothetical protein
MSLQSIVLGSEVKNNSKVPSDSSPQKKIIITSQDEHEVQKDATGWCVWLTPEGEWHHLGGSPTKKATIYILSLRKKRKKRGKPDSPLEWRWKTAKDQNDAMNMWERYGKQ